MNEVELAAAVDEVDRKARVLFPRRDPTWFALKFGLPAPQFVWLVNEDEWTEREVLLAQAELQRRFGLDAFQLMAVERCFLEGEPEVLYSCVDHNHELTLRNQIRVYGWEGVERG